jgi:hypothetical protein
MLLRLSQIIHTSVMRVGAYRDVEVLDFGCKQTREPFAGQTVAHDADRFWYVKTIQS